MISLQEFNNNMIDITEIYNLSVNEKYLKIIYKKLNELDFTDEVFRLTCNRIIQTYETFYNMPSLAVFVKNREIDKKTLNKQELAFLEYKNIKEFI